MELSSLMVAHSGDVFILPFLRVLCESLRTQPVPGHSTTASRHFCKLPHGNCHTATFRV